jgi:hypothetical protein
VRSVFCPGGLLPVKNGNPEVILRKSKHCRRKAIHSIDFAIPYGRESGCFTVIILN